MANDGAVKYIKVHALLTETPGVEDFTDLLINGSTDNIHIENDEYPYTENVGNKGGGVMDLENFLHGKLQKTC